MVDITLYPIRIKYRGIYDLDGLVKTIRAWYEDNGYEFQEKALKYKVPSPAGSELELNMYGDREVTEYAKNIIKIYFHIYDIKKMEIIKDGKKKKVVSARMMLEITPTLSLDYSKRFGGSKFLRALDAWFRRFIIKQDIDNILADRLYYRTYRLHRVIKEYLDMETKTNAAEGRW